MVDEQIQRQKRQALDFCVSHFTTEMEQKHCLQKILENVEYNDASYAAPPLTM